MVKINIVLYISLLVLKLLLPFSLSFPVPSGYHSNTTLNNFAFGSCFYGRLSTRLDIFNQINKHNPELWVWLGDAAYVDKIALWDYWKSSLEVNFTLAEEIFSKSRNNEYYVKLEQKIPTIGIWDDHDFAINDGNGHFAYKEISKKLYLDFIDEPLDSERRTPGRGIYTTYSFGDTNTHKTARMILLDVRYNKTRFLFDDKADILGEDQWTWLEEVLRNSNETFTFIGTGIQVLPFTRLLSEAWYGSSRMRLFNLISKYKKSGVIILSGDIHCAQILKTFCIMPEIGYDLYEITSSGLSHYLPTKISVDYIFPNDYYFLPTIDTYNFAKIDITYGNNKFESKVEVSIVDAENILRTKLTIPYTKLIFDDSNKDNNSECTTRINRRFKTPWQYIEYYYTHKLEIIFLIPILWIMYFFYYLVYITYWIIKKIVYYAFKIISLMLIYLKITSNRDNFKKNV